MVVINVNFVLSILSIVIQFLAGCAFANDVTKRGVKLGKIESCGPSGYKAGTCGFGNDVFSVNYFDVVLCVLSFFMLFVEVGLLAGFSYAMYFNSDLIRGLIYIFKGVACLGASGDLGVAAGALEMTVGLILFILGIITFVKTRGEGSSNIQTQ